MTDVLILGGLGQLGRELSNLFDGPRACALDRSALDICRAADVERVIGDLRPRLVINAAAYTAVDLAESEGGLADAVNGLAPGYVARACQSVGAAILHLSTDYVFDGSGTRPWREEDPSAPLNRYGRSKLLGEQAVRQACSRHVILRTSWVFGRWGRNFVKTIGSLLKQGRSLRVVDDQVGGPTPARDLAQAIQVIAERIISGDDPQLFGTFHYCGQPFVSWHGLACQIADVVDPDGAFGACLVPVASADYPLPAVRPANSRLDCSKIARIYGIEQPDWRRALAAVIQDLRE